MLPQLLTDLELKASDAGCFDAVDLCQVRQGPIGPQWARLILTRCLSAVSEQPEPAPWLMVGEVADLMRVGESKVRQWLDEGRLKSVDVSNAGRTQHRIHIDALKFLDTSETPSKPRRQPNKSEDFFPEY